MNASSNPSTKKPTFREAWLFWLKLGFISFGGPAGQIAIMHEFLVDKKRWISDSKFLHALNYCMLLPGPEAQQLATYIGWLLHGIRGGLVAGLLFVLPSVFILLGLSTMYVLYGSIPWVYALFNGLKPAVIAVVVLALIKIGKKSLLKPLHYLIAGLSFLALYVFNIPFPLIILSALGIAFVLNWLVPQVLKVKKSEEKKVADESGYYLNSLSVVSGTGFHPVQMVKKLLVGLICWLLPFLLFFAFSATDDEFWQTLSLFFTKAALVTFGGAYAVLPYVAQVTVEKYHWLSQYQMIDGLALGETTPGPLIMVLAFVGFMAGYNQFGSLLAGTFGLLVTTYYTFLPCFLFIFIGAPVIERTQHNPMIKAVLGVVTAAVVGVILNLTLYFGKAVLFSGTTSWQAINYFNLAWLLISFIAMYRLKVSLLVWIGVSMVVGLLQYVVASHGIAVGFSR